MLGQIFKDRVVSLELLIFQHSMLYFFHHYELPVILQQAQIRSLFNLQHQFHIGLTGISLTGSKQEQRELGVVEVEEQVQVLRVLKEKEGGLHVLGCGVSPWVVFAFASALSFTPFTSRLGYNS